MELLPRLQEARKEMQSPDQRRDRGTATRNAKDLLQMLQITKKHPHQRLAQCLGILSTNSWDWTNGDSDSFYDPISVAKCF